ncbi:MAG TPA: tetratricopeptide repeat protein [Terriglobales bacterium]|nr:tetratricopeptide repeat protein [Terriglobales bacterium]
MRFLPRAVGARLLVACASLVAGSGIALGQTPVPAPGQPAAGQRILHFRPDDIHTRRGFDYFYNLDYDKAVREFELALELQPKDPFAVNHLLSGVIFKEMYRIGALDSELYAKDAFLSSKQFPMDPNVKARIRELTERSLALSEEKLKANSSDIDALYTRGVTRGLHAMYIGLIEKAWFSALRSAVGARHDHEKVLELNSNYSDAKMIVGIHNYVIGSLNLATKVAASIVGLSGSKKKGIEYLYDTVNGGGENTVDAAIALALFLRREQRYAEAIKLIDGLSAFYPHNFLFALELANLYNAAGHGPEAIAAYRGILSRAQSGVYGEPRLGMVYYGLAEALRGQRDYAGAAEAYDKALQNPRIDPDLRARATLGAGEMYDLINKRDDAVKRYEAVIAADGSGAHAEIARKRLKEPYQNR